MIAYLLALELSIGIGSQFNIQYYRDDMQQKGALGVISVRQDITDNLYAEWYHASLLGDGFNNTVEDRNYVSIMYKVEL